MSRILESFERALTEPAQAQRRVLAGFMQRGRNTVYGRAHRFAECTDYERFAQHVPVVSYDALAPYMERMLAGAQNELFPEPVLYLGTSSGTTGRKKYVPIHEGFAAETDAWMELARHYLERAHPALTGLPELRYVNRVEGASDAGVPLGSVSGWYYGHLRARNQYSELVPYEAYQLADVLARNYAVLRFSLARGFGQMSAVNPSTLLLLAQRLAADAPALLRDLHDGGLQHEGVPAALKATWAPQLPADPARAAALEQALGARGTLRPTDAWPELKLLSCWINAGAGLYRADLQTAFGAVPVWDYGYTSTEGRVTVTYDDEGAGVPLLDHVFLELRTERGVEPLFSVGDGVQGELVVTNSRGLYRYAMGDVVEVAGRLKQAPLLRFRRKTTAVASLTGEKLSEDQVVETTEACLRAAGLSSRFSCLAPEWGAPPRYRLLLELSGPPPGDAALQRLAAALERGLCERNAEYERKRETLRLGPTGLFLLEPGECDRYVDRLVQSGRERARLKLPRVTMDLELLKGFKGRPIEP